MDDVKAFYVPDIMIDENPDQSSHHRPDSLIAYLQGVTIRARSGSVLASLVFIWLQDPRRLNREWDGTYAYRGTCASCPKQPIGAPFSTEGGGKWGYEMAQMGTQQLEAVSTVPTGPIIPNLPPVPASSTPSRTRDTCCRTEEGAGEEREVQVGEDQGRERERSKRESRGEGVRAYALEIELKRKKRHWLDSIGMFPHRHQELCSIARKNVEGTKVNVLHQVVLVVLSKESE
ncbi:hypothetical protein FB446DRAFT_710122 [Lentinula raphanica]|nr:hypothetical protein FB446DRAFT_710122 [Lentinula raphanica]